MINHLNSHLRYSLFDNPYVILSIQSVCIIFSFRESLYFIRILDNMILLSIIAKCYPMQFLPPAENGIKANGSIDVSLRVPSAFHLDISNYFGLGKYLSFN